MHFAIPEHKTDAVNRAGRYLVDCESGVVPWQEQRQELGLALTIVNNWRASHAYPAHILFCGLKRHAKRIHSSALVAQRNKRLPSITAKLARSDQMKLSQMQDIGGCRAVLKTVKQVRSLQDVLLAAWDKHEARSPRDYIDIPKADGYRSVHLRYCFAASGMKLAYDGLKVEIQLRTQLQHRWATAVEAVDTFTKQSLKASRGRPEWARFFLLMSALYALEESGAPVPDTGTDAKLIVREIKDLERRYSFSATLDAIKQATREVHQQAGAQLFLVMLDSVDGVSRIRSYKTAQQTQAQEDYAAAEKLIHDGQQIVLITASSIAQLRRAYPNYFLDIEDFLFDVESTLL